MKRSCSCVRASDGRVHIRIRSCRLEGACAHRAGTEHRTPHAARAHARSDGGGRRAPDGKGARRRTDIPLSSHTKIRAYRGDVCRCMLCVGGMRLHDRYPRHRPGLGRCVQQAVGAPLTQAADDRRRPWRTRCILGFGNRRTHARRGLVLYPFFARHARTSLGSHRRRSRRRWYRPPTPTTCFGAPKSPHSNHRSAQMTARSWRSAPPKRYSFTTGVIPTSPCTPGPTGGATIGH